MIPANLLRKVYVESKRPDTVLLTHMLGDVSGALKYAARNAQTSAEYIVPAFLVGPWPTYDVADMTLKLMDELRSSGYSVELLSKDPYKIRISGWATDVKESLDSYKSITVTAPTTAKKPAANSGKVITLVDIKDGTASKNARSRVQDVIKRLT